MIKSIHIKNFQSHRDTKIELSKGLNAIIGDSQNGKTAILRSLLWVMKNKPLSGKIYNNDARKEPVSVKVETFDGNKVKLEKKIGKDKKVSKSTYTINDQAFSAFGTTPPHEVDVIMNMSDLNFQKQLDPAFLITSTAGEISKAINKITRMEDTDSWIKQLTSAINSENKRASIINEDIIDIEEKLEKYDGLESIEKYISKYEKLTIKIDKIYNKLSDIKNIISKLSEIDSDIKKLKDIYKHMSKIKTRYEAIENDLDEYSAKRELLIKYKSLMNEIEYMESAEKTEELFSKLENVEKQAMVCDIKIELIIKHSECMKKIRLYETLLTKTTKEYEKILKEKAICPKCGANIENFLRGLI